MVMTFSRRLRPLSGPTIAMLSFSGVSRRAAVSVTCSAVTASIRSYDVADVEHPADEGFLRAHPRRDGPAVLHAQHQPAGHEAFGALDLLGRHAVLHASHLGQYRRGRGVGLRRVGARVDDQRAAVAEVDYRAVDVVGEAQPLADFQEEPAAHALAQDHAEQVERVPFRRGHRRARHGDGDVGLLGTAVLDDEPRLRLLAFERRPRGRFARLPVAAQLGDLADDGVVGETCRRRSRRCSTACRSAPRAPGRRPASSWRPTLACRLSRAPGDGRAIGARR